MARWSGAETVDDATHETWAEWHFTGHLAACIGISLCGEFGVAAFVIALKLLMLRDEQGAELVLGEGKDKELDALFRIFHRLQNPTHGVFLGREVHLNIRLSDRVLVPIVDRLLRETEAAGKHLLELGGKVSCDLGESTNTQLLSLRRSPAGCFLSR